MLHPTALNTMQVSREVFVSLVEAVSAALRPSSSDDAVSDNELEVSIVSTVSRQQFTDVLRYFRSTVSSPDGVVQQTRSLDVSMDIDGTTLRATFDDVDGPLDFQRTDDDVVPRLIRKRRVHAPVVVSEHGFRVNVKREIPVPTHERSHALKLLSDASLDKTLRLKTRFSFPVPNSAFRYDFTAVRQVSASDVVRAAAHVRNARETYEMEVEYVGGGVPAATADDVARALLRSTSLLLKTLYDTDYLLPASAQSAVLREYAAMMGPSAKDKRGDVRFAVPKPVSLHREHLTEQHPASPATNVFTEEYTVTEKADGELRLLVVDAQGRVFTIDDRLLVRYTGISTGPSPPPSRRNCVFAGEFIRGRGNTRSSFVCFDAYVSGGRDVRSIPLLPEGRLRECEALVKGTNLRKTSDSDMDVGVKSFAAFKTPTDMFRQCRTLIRKWKAGMFPYSIDGLIFTPSKRPVPASAMTWQSTLKWKPPSHNTIDFLVRFRDDDMVVRNGVPCRVLMLYVAGTSADPSSDDASLSASKIWGRGIDVALRPHKNPPKHGSAVVSAPSIVPVLFRVPDDPRVTYEAHVPCTLSESDDEAFRVVLEDGDEITHDSVVEMAYVLGEKDDVDVHDRWRPLRVRHDKTQRYATTGSVAGTANALHTATDIWKLIHSPVTEEMLTGAEAVPPSATAADEHRHGSAYYVAKKGNREDTASWPMVCYHNWIKRHHMLLRFSDRVSSIMDIGCGRGGDLSKWLAMPRVSVVLGIDLHADNINNPIDGAYARLLRLERDARRVGDPRNRPTIVFLPMDASKRIDATYIKSIRDEGDRYVAKVLWALVPASGVRAPSMRTLHGLATRPFDLISCQFAIHYFLRDVDTLRAFAINVATHLAEGGLFVGTCLDGDAVTKALASGGDGETLESRMPDARGRMVTVWRIKRVSHDDRDSGVLLSGLMPKERRLGCAIEVYMETIGQALVEYLVDYETLKDAFEEVGLLPPVPEFCGTLGLPGNASTGMFGDLYDEFEPRMRQEADAGNKSSAAALTMTDEHRRISFMNRWFVFQKRSSTMPVVGPRKKRGT